MDDYCMNIVLDAFKLTLLNISNNYRKEMPNYWHSIFMNTIFDDTPLVDMENNNKSYSEIKEKYISIYKKSLFYSINIFDVSILLQTNCDKEIFNKGLKLLQKAEDIYNFTSLYMKYTEDISLKFSNYVFEEVLTLYINSIEKMFTFTDRDELIAYYRSIKRKLNLGVNYFLYQGIILESYSYCLSCLSENHDIDIYFVDYFNNSSLNRSEILDYPYKKYWSFHNTPKSQWFVSSLWSCIQRTYQGKRPESILYFFLTKRNITSYGKKNIKEVIEVFDQLVREFEAKSGKYLVGYAKEQYKINDISRMIKFQKLIQDLGIEAENKVRESKNVPRIGEGWISETILYYEIKEHFNEMEVIHHGRPRFLGKQHIDIWIPKIKIGIEFQGEQHYRSIQYFGGNDAFEKQIKRDEKKANICAQNDVRLIYVMKDYNIERVIKEIFNISRYRG